MTLEESNSTPRLPKPFPNIPSNVLQQFSMSNKVTAITGASAGIGWAVAEAIAEAGGHVALLYNSNSEAIAKGLKLAELHNVQVKAYQLEVSDPERVEETINSIVRDFGRLDVFVANAGMAISKPLTETSVEEYRRQMEVNSEFSLLFSSPLRCWDDGEVRLRMDLTLPPFFHSRWCRLSSQIRRSRFQETRLWQSYYHCQYLCSHRQRAYRSARE